MQNGRPILNSVQEAGPVGGMLSGDTMLDVEYLVAPPHNDRPIVYCYRTGILLPQMKNALREIAARDGMMVSTARPGHSGS